MANIPLKTIKFPGLDDTYTVPQVDDDLDTAGAAADAKATGDALTEINERLGAMDTATSEDVGKALSPKTVENGKVTEWQYKGIGGGGGGTSDYADLSNKPQINSVTLSGNKSLSDIGAASEVNVDESLHDFVTVIAGYDFLGATITEDKFANYSSKIIQSFTGASVAEFDVRQVAKFRYRYTIGTPDLRGLYFADKNGTALSGIQTTAKEQDITVPAGAVKCFATVNSIEDIWVYQITAGEHPEELLKAQASYNNRTSGDITYTWNNDHSKCTIAGTRSATSFCNMAGGSTTLPTGIKAGEKYNFVFNPVSPYIYLSVLIYVNGDNTVQKNFNAPTIYEIPANATGVVVRLQVIGSGVSVSETVDCPEILTVPPFKSIYEQIGALNDAVYGTSDDPLAYIRKDAGLLPIFHSVGCIGDSLASGACAHNEGGTVQYTDYYDFSWGQCLARLTDNTYYNFSQGGLSSRTWLASSHATDCFDGNHLCDAYYIGLGQNDKNSSIPVGTTADINLADYTQNADTYCGNIGQIIQRLQILQPKAPIFVFIDPNPPQGDQAYNDVIPGIVALFDNVWIIDLKTYGKALFTEPTEIIGSQARSGHYSALGYQEIAYVIATYTDWIIRRNISAFSQVEFIGTEYSWASN